MNLNRVKKYSFKIWLSFGGYKVFDSFQKTKNRKNICSTMASELELMVTSLENLTS